MRTQLLLLLAALSGCTHTLATHGDDFSSGAVDMALPTTLDGALRFAVFGDVRPGRPDDTSSYPTQVVSASFQRLAALSPAFVVGTGDYMFASTEDQVAAQLDLLLGAEKAYAGPVYHVLGNHECTGATASNCPLGNETPNMRAFMQRLAPAGAQLPYWRIDVDTPKGKAKVVFVAANAWTDAQAEWLKAQLAEPTAYTFVVRHEPPSTTETPGVAPSEAIIHSFPLTLELNGHWHVYQRIDDVHVVSGNGGAPMRSGEGGVWGFLLVEQLASGDISVNEIDQATGNVTDAWRVTADGKAAP